MPFEFGVAGPRVSSVRAPDAFIPDQRMADRSLLRLPAGADNGRCVRVNFWCWVWFGSRKSDVAAPGDRAAVRDASSLAAGRNTVAVVLCARDYPRFKLGTRPSLAALLLKIVLASPQAQGGRQVEPRTCEQQQLATKLAMADELEPPFR